jgi:hypothetical protein
MAETPTQKRESHVKELKSHFKDDQTGVYGTYYGVKVFIILGRNRFRLMKMAADTQSMPDSIPFNSGEVMNLYISSSNQNSL